MRTLLLLATAAIAADPVPPPRGNAMLDDYFARQVVELESTPLPLPKSADDWEKTRLAWRAQLAEMLGLSPMPERTPLNVTKTGEVAGEGFVVEKLHYHSRPGLYVTANLFRPAEAAGKLPAILYVCGHADVKGKDGTSLGNKAGYEHHGAWFARHGYVCLVIDTVQLGEIRGEHHGTYSKGRWWWISRGYTPAGLEAWSGIRALDYLETRADVDATRMGVTGRSGGGVYSWWIAALDDRIKVAAPTAGITTLRNHVVDGCVEGHCDCMFMVNTHRWDYDKVAALIAPRPLLIANTDKDNIFPLDGVMAIHASVRRIYRALGADGKLGLQIAEGPHKDTQSLNTGAFAWFERFLKGADLMATLDEPAKKRTDPEQLRVFTELPKDEINTTADETFVAAARPVVPADAAAFEKQRVEWMRGLREKVFAGWPKEPCALALREAGTETRDGVTMRAWDFTPQEPWRLRLLVVHDAAIREPGDVKRITLIPADDGPPHRAMLAAASGFPALLGTTDPGERGAAAFAQLKVGLSVGKNAYGFILPRGTGSTAWSGSEKQQTQRLRRFYLLGQTLDGMRVWDIRRSIAALREAGFAKAPLHIHASGTAGVNALYASLFEQGVESLDLKNIPISHQAGPTYLSVLQVLDIPQAAAMAAARCESVQITARETSQWHYTEQAVKAIGREGNLHLNYELPPVRGVK